MDDGPYRSPSSIGLDQVESCKIQTRLRRFSFGICMLNTCSSGLFAFWLLLPASFSTTEELLIGRTLGWWNLIGVPITTFLVIWSLSSRDTRIHEHMRLMIWCVILLLLWLLFVGLLVLAFTAEN